MLAGLLCATDAVAQSTRLRIHYKDGTRVDIPVSTIDSLTVVGDDTPDAPQTATLVGSWLWAGADQGYYEVLTFLDDHTYTGYDNYFTYGFDSQTYGRYTVVGAMLNLQAGGYGYAPRYSWYVTALTDNALAVVTHSGPFTYYRVQDEVLHLGTQGTPLSPAIGEAFVFADGVTAIITADGRLLGLSPGTTYVQKRLAQSGLIVAYKVQVE